VQRQVPVLASALAPPPAVLVEAAADAAKILDVVPVSGAPALANIALPAPGSAPAATMRALFRNPQTLAAAIVLHEVLGPPRSKRRWSR
jgi:hypothetical protein